MNMYKPKVLFLCVGNSARSQMAEVFLRKYGADHFEVHSAGLAPKGINPYTKQVIEEVGIDLRGQRSKMVEEYLGKESFRYVIIVCSSAEENCPRIYPGVQQKLYWPFEDPAAFVGTEEETLNKFREVRDQIEERIKGWVKEQVSSL